MSSSLRERTRPVVSLLTGWGFAVMGLTGLVLYIEPHGRVAYWTGWTLLGLGKAQWDGIHVVSSFVFLAAGAIHLYYNWRPFVRFLGSGSKKRPSSHIALSVASSIALLAVASGIWHLPPAAYLLDLNEWAKGVWVTGPEDAPPFGHAEMHSLASFCSKMHVDLEGAIAELEGEGIALSTPQESIEDIARNNGTTPAGLYGLIRHQEGQGTMSPTRSEDPSPAPEDPLQLVPIGYIHSPHTPEAGAPHQGRRAPGSRATIEVAAEYEAGLRDLETFSHIIVIYAFDQAGDWQPMVQTPWDETPHGVFAVRSPNRPNPIGLTIVELEGRSGRTLAVRGLDAYDGSPVLDIKPYIPSVDIVEGASSGWLEGRSGSPDLSVRPD